MKPASGAGATTSALAALPADCVVEQPARVESAARAMRVWSRRVVKGIFLARFRVKKAVYVTANPRPAYGDSRSGPPMNICTTFSRPMTRTNSRIAQ